MKNRNTNDLTSNIQDMSDKEKTTQNMEDIMKNNLSDNIRSNFSEDDAYFSEDNDREDKSEDSGT